MTDIHGSDPDNREDALRDADVQDSITEVPSEYEFSDGLSPDDAAEGKPARRSALLPIVAALGGVIVLGGVAWWQLGGNPGALLGAAGASMPLPGAMTSFTQPATPPNAAPLAPTTPKTSAMAPVDSVSEGAASVASSSALPNEPVAPALQVKPDVAPALPASVVESAVSAPLPAPTPSVVASTPAVSAVTMPAADKRADPQVDTLSARVEELQKALDQANQQLKSAIPPEIAAANEAVLQDRINKLEQQVATLTQKGPEAEASAATLGAEPQTDAPKVAASSKPKAAVKKAVAAKPMAKKAVQPEKASWVLRSASPGTAWISKTSDSLELREVHVGDKLPGIGRVTTIESQDDSWVVHGTSGSIH